MPLNLRANFLCHHKNCRIRDNQRVRPQGFQFPQIFFHSRKVFIMRQYVHRDMHSGSVTVGKLNSFPHVFHGKIFSLGAKPKSLAAHIYRVGSVYHCRLQNFQAACRNQKFRASFFISHLHSSFRSFFTLSATPSPRGMMEV